jgi:hypothetical protein
LLSVECNSKNESKSQQVQGDVRTNASCYQSNVIQSSDASEESKSQRLSKPGIFIVGCYQSNVIQIPNNSGESKSQQNGQAATLSRFHFSYLKQERRNIIMIPATVLHSSFLASQSAHGK